MADLILLYIDAQEPVRCIDLDGAERKINTYGDFDDKAFIKCIPVEGGPVSSLKYSSADGSWLAYQP